MNTGGFSEAIWHFAGYLRVLDTIYTVYDPYDGDPTARSSEDDPARLNESVQKLDFDDIGSQAVGFVETPPANPSFHSQKLTVPGFAGPKMALEALPRGVSTSRYPDSEAAGFQVGGPLFGKRIIAVEYEQGGTETVLSVHQISRLSDRDELTSDTIRDAHGEPVSLPAVHAEEAIARMWLSAEEAVAAPLTVEMTGDTATLTGAISAMDTYWATEGHLPGRDGATSVSAGRYVDGQISSEQLAEPQFEQIAPWRIEDVTGTTVVTAAHTVVGPTHGVATIAETGLNVQSNAAAIIDANEATGSMIVGGNAYFSRGIVQVNVLTDNDHVDIATDRNLPAVFTHGNEVHNVAEFVEHDMSASYRGAAGTPFWHVDVLAGNFYDVKTIVQFNGLDDNDRTLQATAETYFEAKTGLNTQANLAQVTNLDAYDIIIIGGDYHRADWIFQYNIMLDSDVAKLFSAGDAHDGGTTVSAGFDRLSNTASITTYDSADFLAMTAAHRALLDGLAQGVTVLTPDAGWQMTGSSTGTLNILFVSGDYYDVNVITQTNVMADVDQSIQATATGGTQGIALGGNVAANLAEIVDPGTLSKSKYLGGAAYEDAILIQANLVSDNDVVTIHDTTTLVSELVAFAHESEAPPESVPLQRPMESGHHDILL